MADQIILTLEPRTVLGKGLNKLRRDGLIPAIIHDHGKESVAVMVAYTDMLKTYKNAGKHHPLSLKVGSKDYMAMIKDVDFEPKKQLMRHVVFNAIKLGEKVEAEIPLHVVGDIPAEKMSLMVLNQLDHVLVSALPNNLPDELTVDGTKLVEIGDRLTVADIIAPQGVVILTEPEHQIAVVEEPRVQEVEEVETEPMEGEETPEEGKEAKETSEE